MNLRLFIAGLAVLAALLAAWLLSGDRHAPLELTSRASEVERDPTAPLVTQSSPEAAVESTPDAERTSVAPASGPVQSDGRRATLSGRCVDEDGTPLSGVRVTLHGAPGDSRRLQRYRLEHGDVQWEDPADVITAADGRFAFTFVPPPPYQYVCDMTVDGRVPMRIRRSELRAEPHDLGDVVLPRGVEVRGRVVDGDGVGVAGVDVTADPRFASLSSDVAFPRPSVRTTADAAGHFRFAALPVGRVGFQLAGRPIAEPARAVDLSPPRQEVRIVTAEWFEDPRPAIRGRVFDAAGAPVDEAHVRAGDPSAVRSSGAAESDREGRFLLRVTAAGEDPQPIWVEADGYELWRSAAPVPLGTGDLNVRLLPGPPLTVRVTRAPDGEPVERYAISLAPVRDHGTWMSRDSDILHVGDHPGGVLELPRVTPRRYRLTVHVAESLGFSQPEPLTIEVEPRTPLTVDVELRPFVDQEVVVVDAAGEPVVGVKVESLAHTAGGEVTLAMHAKAAEAAHRNSAEEVAELVAEGTTDAAGTVRLRGPLGRDVALRLPGPGHVPKVVQPVRLGEERLRVVVERGAVLRGRVEPVEVLAQLRAEGATDAVRLGGAPAIALFREAGEPRRFPLPASPSGRKEPPSPTTARSSSPGFRPVPGTWCCAGGVCRRCRRPACCGRPRDIGSRSR